MKRSFTIIRVAALVILLSQLVACAKHYHTDNKRPQGHKYRGAGRAW